MVVAYGLNGRVQPIGPSPSLLDHIQQTTLSLGLNKIRITYKKENLAKHNKYCIKNIHKTLETHFIFEYML